MEIIKFENSSIHVEFVVNDDKQIKLTFFGDKKNYINKPSTFVEVDFSEFNHNGLHCLKLCNTPYGELCRYVKHVLKDNELIITTKTNEVEIDTHFIFYKNVKGLTSFNVVKNISNRSLHLEYISSFYLYGLGQNIKPANEEMYVGYASNSWLIESQWKQLSFFDAGLYNANDTKTMKRFVLNNTGSWSSKEYLPICYVYNKINKQLILSQIENNGSWHIEISDNNKFYYLSMGGPDWFNNSFSKTLMPNEEFISCKASTVISKNFEQSVQEMTKLRRQITSHSIDHKEMPIIFNDFMHGTWDLSKEEQIIPLIDISNKVKADIFCLDAGWFAKSSGWNNFIGEWKEEKENYPSGGLIYISNYIHRKNMKMGLWFEIENVGISCSIANKFTDDMFFMVNGNRTIRNNKYSLDFTNQKVYKWAIDTVSSNIDQYSLDYIKIDYNIDVGTGNENNSDSLGDGLLKHNRAFIKWIKELQNKYPNLTIESCASGGQRMDYEILKYCPIQSVTDLEDYRKMPYIAANVNSICLPESGAIWSYPVCNDNMKIDITDEVVIFNMVNSFLGRMHLSSKLYLLNDYQLDLVKEAVISHKKLNDFKKNALPIFPVGAASFNDKYVCGGLINKSEGIICVWNTSNKPINIKIDLSKYKVSNLEIYYPIKVETKYKFNKKSGVLTIKFPDGFMGRVFKFFK